MYVGAHKVEDKTNVTYMNLYRTLAVGSFEVLQNAKVFNSLEESIADLNKVFAALYFIIVLSAFVNFWSSNYVHLSTYIYNVNVLT
jgi:hypothetical protein